MRLRILLAGLVASAGSALAGGCVVTMSYDDFGDQKSGSDAGADAYVCVPKTCADKNANCGDVPDDCGKILQCGECSNGETCGGAGPNQCGSGPCQPETCNSLGASCGTVSDGCGKALECGNCTLPKICGSEGVVNQCVCPGVIITCGSVGAECGQIADGCGGTTDCGSCSPPFKCGSSASGQNTANKCVCGNTCASLGVECGSYPSYCDETSLDCGLCQIGTCIPDTEGTGKCLQI
jgi:hypothetical protein